MILMLVIAAWILALSFVAGLCVAARRGDLAQPSYRAEARTWQRGESLLWESPAHQPEIVVRANTRPLESDQPLRHGGGIAA